MKRQTKILLVINVLLILFLGFILIRENYPQKIYKKFNSYNASVKRKGDTGITYWLNRQELFEVLPKDSNSIIFLGNSLTSNFELAELFHDLRVKNRGISGDYIPGLLNRLTPIIQTQPRKIFIEIGINDLDGNYQRDTVIANYEKLLDTLQKACRTTKIYVQSLFPVSNTGQRPLKYLHPELNKLNENVREINKALKKYTASHNITFVDLYDKFALNGELNIKYSVDGEHLTGAAYLLWTELLRPYVQE